MSRIVFLAQGISPATTAPIVDQLSWEMICHLRDHNHQIKVLTSQGQDLDFLASFPGLEVLTPFHRWNWLELAGVVPLLVEFDPEIMHIVPQASATFAHSTNLLAWLHYALSKPLLVTSLLDQAFYPSSPLIRHSDIVTCLSLQQMTALRSSLRTKTRLYRLPASMLGAHQPQDAKETTIPFASWLYVSGDYESWSEWKNIVFTFLSHLTQFSDPSVGMVLGGRERVTMPVYREFMRELADRGFSDRVLWCQGPAEQTAQAGSQLVILAAATALSAENELRLALAHRKLVLITKKQIDELAIPSSLAKTLLVIENLSRAELTRLWPRIAKRLHEPSADSDAEIDYSHAVGAATDDSGNFLSRLYVAGLEQKRNHT